MDWSVPGRDPLDDFAFPLIHYSIVLCGWSLCLFLLRAETAKQAEHRHAMRAEAGRCAPGSNAPAARPASCSTP
jgi:hypothetical protein